MTLAAHLAATIDARLEHSGWGGLFHHATSTRPWWYLSWSRDAQAGPQHRPGWTLQVGRWELVRDGRGPVVTVW